MEASQTLGSRAREGIVSAGWVTWVVLGLGLAGGLLMVLTEFLLIFQVDTLTAGTCEELANRAVRDTCRAEGLEQHSGALLLLGGLAIAMTIGASRPRSLAAGVALVVVGAVVLGIALVLDLPKTNSDGLLEPFYEQGRARAGPGFYGELLGAGLCIVAGALRLVRRGS